MEEMISLWIRETQKEHDLAKQHQNLFKMNQMYRLERALSDMRVKLLK